MNRQDLGILLVIGFLVSRYGVSSHAFPRDTLHLEDDLSHGGEQKTGFEHTNECKGPDCDACPGKGKCVPPVGCPALVRPNSKSVACHLPGGGRGVCCYTGQNHTTDDDLKARSSLNIDERTIKEAKAKSQERVTKLLEKDAEIRNNTKHQTVAPRGHPTFGHFQSQRSIEPEATNKIGMAALHNLFAMEALKERNGITNEQMALGLDPVVVDDIPCLPQPKCEDNNKYRTLDGTCNNPVHPTWGASKTATERLLPPHYDDGIWSPRKSSFDQRTPLKSPRYASSNLLPDKDRPHPYATLLTMQFGQFIAHDVSSSVTLTFANGSGISCCAEDGSTMLPPELQHFGCYPIEVEDDFFYSEYGQKCMNFVRTTLAPNHDCSLGYAKQMNGVTHFLDLSHIYASDPDTLGPLREFSGGKMSMTNDFGRELLPLSDDKNDCVTMEQGSACFKSGDGHANQMISLVAVHMVFTREHNRVAGILQKLNPHWSDQLLFLEARKIVIAQYQHVIYNEYLPLVLGEKAMSEFRLRPKPHGDYSFDYNAHTNPSLTAEFAVAAFRFGHSNVDGHLRVPAEHELDEVISIPEVMFHPARMRIKEFYDRLLKGLTSQPMQDTDPSVSKMLTRYLFRGGHPFGIDLGALNMQRSRDHGLRCYNDYRQLVGLPRIQSMHEFGPKVAEHLGKVYMDVNDVDLWIGGLLETPEKGALVGYTFREIIADQFSRLKHGDRYFYEHGPATNPGHFTPAQLAQIKQTSMARLICDNSDHIELHEQSPHAFVRPDVAGNEGIDCSKSFIPFVDLSPWKEFQH